MVNFYDQNFCFMKNSLKFQMLGDAEEIWYSSFQKQYSVFQKLKAIQVVRGAAWSAWVSHQ